MAKGYHPGMSTSDVIRRAGIVAACLLLGACAAGEKIKESAVGEGGGVQAVLTAARGGTGRADVRFVDRGNGVYMLAFVTALPPGPYRIAVHEKGNCSSPNFFSAGPAWAPPGHTRAPKDLVPVFYLNSDGDSSLSEQIPGLHAADLMGRSVVLHMGRTVDDFEPGVSNNGMLCGVIGPLRSFLE